MLCPPKWWLRHLSLHLLKCIMSNEKSEIVLFLGLKIPGEATELLQGWSQEFWEYLVVLFHGFPKLLRLCEGNWDSFNVLSMRQRAGERLFIPSPQLSQLTGISLALRAAPECSFGNISWCFLSAKWGNQGLPSQSYMPHSPPDVGIISALIVYLSTLLYCPLSKKYNRKG